MSTRPVITLLTDFGLSDHYVGAMKGVILGICPEAQLVDISHEVTPYAITEAAYTLSQAWNCFPPGTIHLVVVDPGVGSARRPIAAEADGHYFVAPDNGVLSMVFDQVAKSRVWELNGFQYYRQPVSRTFHGRDIFAPMAAQLAQGVRIVELGAELADPVHLAFSKPVQIEQNLWRGVILKVDRFGNMITNFPTSGWGLLVKGAFQIDCNGVTISHVAPSYEDSPPGRLFVIAGSSGRLELSLRQQNAASVLGARTGDPIVLRVLL